jgi:hypothetical protein
LFVYVPSSPEELWGWNGSSNPVTTNKKWRPGESGMHQAKSHHEPTNLDLGFTREGGMKVGDKGGRTQYTKY